MDLVITEFYIPPSLLLSLFMKYPIIMELAITELYIPPLLQQSLYVISYYNGPCYNRILYSTIATAIFIQSGTKPNLVAKIWPPNLVTICAWLPKVVASVSSNFHHLVNTRLAVGSFFKWLPIMVAHTCKLDTIWVVYISPIGNGSIRL